MQGRFDRISLSWSVFHNEDGGDLDVDSFDADGECWPVAGGGEDFGSLLGDDDSIAHQGGGRRTGARRWGHRGSSETRYSA